MAHQSSQMRAGPSAYTLIEEKEDAYDKAKLDTNPSDKQPPGTDEDWEPQSLEEALLGEPAGEDSY